VYTTLTTYSVRLDPSSFVSVYVFGISEKKSQESVEIPIFVSFLRYHRKRITIMTPVPRGPRENALQSRATPIAPTQQCSSQDRSTPIMSNCQHPTELPPPMELPSPELALSTTATTNSPTHRKDSVDDCKESNNSSALPLSFDMSRANMIPNTTGESRRTGTTVASIDAEDTISTAPAPYTFTFTSIESMIHNHFSMIEDLDDSITASGTRIIEVFMRTMRRLLETGAWGRRLTDAIRTARLPQLTGLIQQTTSLNTAIRPYSYEPNGDGKVHGIRNYGQTCFMNSVLQSLAASAPFWAYLERVVEIYQERIDFESYNKVPLSSDSDVELTTLSLSEILLRLLRQVDGKISQCYGDETEIDPRVLLQVIGKQHSQFREKYGSGSVGKEQQDAQELLQALVGIIVEDAKLDSASSVSPSLFSPPSMINLNESGNDDNYDDDDGGLTIMDCLRERNRNKESEILGRTVDKEPLEVSVLGESESLATLDLREMTQTNGHNRGCSGSSSLLDEIGERSELPSPTEEKKQEEFELPLPRACSEENLHIDILPMTTFGTSMVADSLEILSDISKNSTMTNAMNIMLSTISSISSSPFSGWMGSALQCRTCKHVRPIQNTPFFDIPVVPEAVSRYFASVSSTAARGDPPRKHSHSSPGPPCRLEDCMKEFTCVERVQDVECRCCTLRAETAEWQEEVDMLQGAISALLARAKRTGIDVENEDEHVQGLRDELTNAQSRVNVLHNTSPDDEGPLETILGNEEDAFMGVETKDRRLHRGEALKCLLITRLPSILCIHVQRRYYDPMANRMSKTLQHVIFPEYLDVAPYCAYSEFGSTNARWGGSFPERPSSRTRAPLCYRLISVIEHRGNAFHGHYVCYRRDPRTGSWLFISDSVVNSVNWQDVQQCQAYMLFYEAM
jgi:ubiquitin C-terminal hydrolase